MEQARSNRLIKPPGHLHPATTCLGDGQKTPLTMRAYRIAVDMMDNASALPTCPQRQQQQKQPADLQLGPHDFTMKHS